VIAGITGQRDSMRTIGSCSNSRPFEWIRG